MPTVKVNVEVELQLTDVTPEAIKTAGREMISALSETSNLNVEDVSVTSVDAIVQYSVDCMPEEEINDLAQ